MLKAAERLTHRCTVRQKRYSVVPMNCSGRALLIQAGVLASLYQLRVP